MIMRPILSLRPNVTREQAVRALLPESPGGLVRRVLMGRLRAVAAVYLPFRLHQVEIAGDGHTDTRFFALDAMSGALDLYEFENVPGENEMTVVETRNRPDPDLDEERSRKILIDRVRRLLFAEGRFRLRHLSISADQMLQEVHVPYWVGFYGSEDDMRLVVIDAVRRRTEGAKVTKLLEGWLLTA